jgi:N-acetylglutamate synthase-like GNAT family acetyltransferase
MDYLSKTFPMRGIPNHPRNGAFSLNKDYKFRKASLLDIPFIFDLIQDGSQVGSFAEKYLTAKGAVQVLSMLILDVLAPHRFIEREGYDIKLLIFALNDEDVGFMKIKPGFADRSIYKIDICAIAPEYRSQKIGSHMIRMFIEDLPSGAEVVMYCTKFSRAMQHILKMLNFQRDKKTTVLHAECFHFTKPSNTA